MWRVEQVMVVVFSPGLLFMASCLAAEVGPGGEGSSLSEADSAALVDVAAALADVDVEEDLLDFADAALDPDLLAGRDWVLDPAVAEDEQDFGTEAVWWTSYVSEENPPLSCGNALVSGSDCHGSYCDGVSLRCDDSAPGGQYSSPIWTSWFSEESMNYRICGNGRYVSGIACAGSYCDRISLECTYTGRNAGGCQWSGYFSEEDPVFTTPAGMFIKGIQCSGSYCDRKRFYYCSP